MALGRPRTRASRDTTPPAEAPLGEAGAGAPLPEASPPPAPPPVPLPAGIAAAQPRLRDAAEAGLAVTGQFLAFEPGLYAVDIVCVRSVATDVGLRLPCVRIEPLPASPGTGQAFVSGAAEGGWLADGATAFVLVVGGRTRVMLSVYKSAAGMASPELRVRPLGAATGIGMDPPTPAPPPARIAAPHPAAPPAPAPPAAAPPAPPAAPPPLPPARPPVTAPPALAIPAPSIPARVPSPGAAGTAKARAGVTLMAHVQGAGDLFSDAQGWAGRAGSGVPVEGFSVAADGVAAGEIEYQAILGDQWNTPWTRGGGFCGSRGMALPILGFRVRLAGAAAERLECRYWGSFVGRGEVGPLGEGEACQAGQAFLEALRVVVTPRVKAPRARK